MLNNLSGPDCGALTDSVAKSLRHLSALTKAERALAARPSVMEFRNRKIHILLTGPLLVGISIS